MRVFHDSRNSAYRAPFGAIAVGSSVELTLDVYDAPGSKAVVRTWVDGIGEGLHEMKAVASPRKGEDAAEVPTRYKATLKPDAAGIVWYQFLITDTEDRVWRYGAKNGRLGGEGQLVGWEPPSFCLSAYDPRGAAPAWYEPIGGYLYDDGACHDLPEVVAALCENYPAALARTAAVWDCENDEPSLPVELPEMECALEAATADACAWFSAEGNVFGFWREGADGCMTCALFNPSTTETHAIAVPMVEEAASELVAGYAVVTGETANVTLRPMGEAVLHFHKKERLARPLEAGLGVLAHITSLPAKGEQGFGTLGAPAHAFVDWLAEAGVRYWQVLPASPTDEFGSPYAGISAFAGNTRLLEGGEPTAAELEEIGKLPAYAEFCKREAAWLEPYACFMAIRQKVGEGITWQEWPKKYLRYSPKLLANDGGLARAAEAIRRSQFLFERQWEAVRSYANERGIQIIGDMPMYVSADSADVWAHPDLFQLGADGLPHVVAGCPPDAFAEDGQIWGNPVYDWDALRESGYDWWLRRLQRAFSLYDFVRLDHFIGFSRYFCIPAGEKAASGEYRLGPGYEFFKLACETFGQLPIIAEDLGLITPRVRGLVASCGFLGMDIIQFADGGDPLGGYAPRPEKIVYTGTHDNQTLLGYIRSRYPHIDEDEAFEDLMRKVVACDAEVRIVPLQDVLGLGDEARMNVPGVAAGNWTWQADAAEVEAALERAKELAK